MKTNKRGIPSEILHYSETDEFKDYRKHKRYLAIENFVFALLCIVIIALSFYMGRIVERHLGFENVKPQKSAYVIKI